MRLAILALLLLSVYSSSKLNYQNFAAPIITEINNDPDSTWTAGINTNFIGYSMEDVRALMGTFLDTPEWMKLPEKEFTPRLDLPDTFDPRTQWPQCPSLKEVRDQANCGSCWAFATVEAITDRYCIKANKPNVRISSEDLLTCCGFTCGMGCNGGFPGSGWSYWVRTGIVSGNLYGEDQYCQPYALKSCDHHIDNSTNPCPSTVPTPACQKSCVNGANYNTEKQTYKGSKSYSVRSSVLAIQQELFENGPVGAAFTVYEDFLTYKSGVYQHKTGGQLGGHAVKLMGWGTENGVDYWLVANSWNPHWGDNGFFKIRRGTNECGFESQIVAGLP